MDKRKRITLFFLIAFTIQFCACSAKQVKEADCYNRFTKEIIEADMESEEVTGDWVGASTAEKYILRSIKRGLKEDGKEGIIDSKWYECDWNTGERTLLEYESLDLFSCINYLPNGNIIVINREKNISIYDYEQRLVCGKNIEELHFKKADQKNIILESARYVYGDGENIYIIGENEQSEGIIYVLDEELNGKLAEVTPGVWNMTAQNGKDIIFFDESKIYAYDSHQNEIYKKSTTSSILSSCFQNIELRNGTSNYEYLYLTNQHIEESTGEEKDYLVGVRNGKHEKIIDLVSMRLQDFNILDVCGDEADGYWFVCEDSMGKNQNIHLCASDEVHNYSNEDMKVQCRVGMTDSAEDILPEIKLFNLQSDQYYLKIYDYSGMYEDIDVANMHLFMDVMNGKLDAVILNDQLAMNLIKNDALYDLTEYVKSNDCFRKENLISNYLESVTTQSGEIYALYPSFEVAGFVSNERIDFSALDHYSSLLEKDKRFIVSYDGTDLLYNIVKFSGNRYLDEITGGLREDSSELLQVMEFLKKQVDCGKSCADQYSQLSTGEAKASFVTIPDPYYYIYYKLLLNNNLSISNVDTDQLLISNRKGLIGISEKSEKKEGIMEFWNYLFEPEIYHKEYTSSCYELPIFKKEYDTWKKRMLATESYVDEYGISFEIIDITYGFGEMARTIEKGSISEEEIDMILAAIQEAEYINPMDDALIGIILEEATAYFAEERSLEETYTFLKKRLDIALEEKK